MYPQPNIFNQMVAQNYSLPVAPQPSIPANPFSGLPIPMTGMLGAAVQFAGLPFLQSQMASQSMMPMGLPLRSLSTRSKAASTAAVGLMPIRLRHPSSRAGATPPGRAWVPMLPPSRRACSPRVRACHSRSAECGR